MVNDGLAYRRVQFLEDGESTRGADWTWVDLFIARGVTTRRALEEHAERNATTCTPRFMKTRLKALLKEGIKALAPESEQ